MWYLCEPFVGNRSHNFISHLHQSAGGFGLSCLWQQVLNCLKDRIPSEQFEEWLTPTKVYKETEKSVQVLVDSEFAIGWIKENYLDEVYAILKEIGFDHVEVDFILPSLSMAEIDTNVEPQNSTVKRNGIRIPKLNSKYSFERFVVGASNQFAHAAALAVAESPSTSYNPLFLYGSSGLGKTHLLHAIGLNLNRTHPDLRICYTTCEEFTNQFINSIRFNKGEAFRERYRSVDILLIDDIQFLSGKTQTQEEFFHTFNALFERQKQIILSSDSSPSEIPKLESRLKSRFQWGLIADIQPPALETRIAILKKKAEQEHTPIPDSVVLYIANKVKTNVRELEGALVKVFAYAEFANRPVDIELAEHSLRHHIKDEGSSISCEKIMRFVAEQHKIQYKELTTRNNSKRIAQPRQIAMYLARHLTGMSLPEIGAAFGNKHHSTVLYSIRKVENRIGDDLDYRALIDSYKKSLN